MHTEVHRYLAHAAVNYKFHKVSLAGFKVTLKMSAENCRVR